MRNDTVMRIKPEHLQNAYINVILMVGIIVFMTWVILFKPKPMKINIYLTIGTMFGAIPFSIYIRHFFRNSVYLTMTPEKVIGYNHFKKCKAEIRWDEIEELYMSSQSWYITIQSKDGKELKTSLPIIDFKTICYTDINGNEVIEKTDYGNYEIVLNEMICRAVNCKKIDFRVLKKKFPRISIYEMGLEKNKNN
jgi:hypothetical protein